MTKYIVAEPSEEGFSSIKSLLQKSDPQAEIMRLTSGHPVFSLVHSENPDIIFINPDLPDIKGTEVCKKLKADVTTCQMPVLLYTYGNEWQNYSEAISGSGADGFFVIPVNELAFKLQLKSLLRCNQAQTETELKRTITELKTNQLLLRTIIENAPFEIWARNREEIGILENNASVKHFGSILGKNLSARNVSPEILEAWKSNNKKVFQGEIFREDCIYDYHGEKKDYHQIIAPLWTDDEITGIVGFNIDINERKKAEKAFMESEERFKLLFEKAPIAYQSLNEHGCLIDVNETWLKLFGYNKNEVTGRWFGDFVTPECRELFKERFSVFKSSGKINIETEILKKDGLVIIAQIKGQIGHSADGFFSQAHCVISDITKEKQAEQKIIQLTKGIEQSPASIVITDTKGDIEYVNSKFTEITGYTFEEAKGKNPRILQSGYTPKEEYDRLWKTIISGNEYHGEFQNRKKNGELYWESVKISPIRNESGKIINYMAIKEDITSRKKSDLEILKLSVAIDQNPASVIITNTEGVIEYANRKFLTVTGYSKDELTGTVVRILKPGHTPEETYVEIWNSLLSGLEWRGEHQNRKKNRERYWESVLLSPIKNAEGKVTNYIILSEDITERKKMEKDLIKAKEKAEESDQLKSAFLANMSHEIRTPLNSILGFSDLLTAPDLDTVSRKEYAELINSSGNNLLAIINDILDISKIEAGQINLNKNIFSAYHLIADIQKEYSFKAGSKGIELRLSKNPDKKLMLFSDETRIRQVLGNFMSNALKFTDSGYIEIGVDKIENSVRFHVKDTGIGIPKEFHKKVFDRFRQVEAAQTRKYGGNGLGLAITKNLAELLGGKIWLESEPDVGSTFYFSLPEDSIAQ